LTEREMKQYEREFTELTPTERDATMALVPSWEQKGIELGMERGIEQGKSGVIARLIRRRFGQDAAPDFRVERLGRLSSGRLDELADALLDFGSRADLDAWLSSAT